MTKKSTNKTGDGATPDYAFWVAMSTWTRDEAIALLSGQDPDSTAENVTPNNKQTKTARLLDRAFESGAFPNADRVTPADCLSAMESFGLSTPKALVTAANANKISIKNWQAECNRKDAEIEHLLKTIETDTSVRPNAKNEANVTALRKKISSLQIVFLGLSITKCKLKRNWKNSSNAPNIASAIRLSGLRIDDDTVRKHLAEAIEAVGEDAKFDGES